MILKRNKKSKVYAIADLHLAGRQNKPMGVFGEHWENHWNKIKENWERNITDNDIVVIPGDISWAMDIKDAEFDLKEIAALPGKQVFVKGNHDYWWSSYSKVCDVLSDNQAVIQNNSYKIFNTVIAGARGWLCPNSPDFKEADQKIYKREAIRLELSLEDAVKKADKKSALIVAMHFPPFAFDKKPTFFTEILEKYSPDCVVFGHIHSPKAAKALNAKINGIRYVMSACDSINFEPIRIL